MAWRAAGKEKRGRRTAARHRLKKPGLRTAVITEGSTRLVVPSASLGTDVPPTAPVFFNPAASLNRDVSVVITEASGGRTFLDTMTGAGARGVRIANEVKREMLVTMSDSRTGSLALARKSATLNDVKNRCSFIRSDANVLLFSAGGQEERFEFVDLDPFGTPAPYLQGVLNAVTDGGVGSVTATDTAVLCGVHPEVARRRYGAVPLNNDFHHETGIRILMNACRKEAAKLDIGVVPVAAHCNRHYMRIFFRVKVGVSEAEAAAKSEGFVLTCGSCGHREVARASSTVCPRCGRKAKAAGPLWVGDLCERKVVAAASRAASKRNLTEARKTLDSLAASAGLPPWSFSLDSICSKLKVPGVSYDGVVSILEGQGFKCARQPFEVRGVKTEASYEDVVDAVRGSTRN